MRVEEVYVDVDIPRREFVVIAVCDNKKRTEMYIMVDKLPHKKERDYFEWKKEEDKLTDSVRVHNIFLGKTPQKIRKMFPGMRMSYRKLRKLMRESSDEYEGND